MRWTLAAAFLLLAGSAIGAYAGDRESDPGRTPGEVVEELLAVDESSVAWKRRDDLLSEIVIHYSDVRKAVLGTIRGSEDASEPLVFGGRLHNAILVAGAWRIEEAERDLTRLAGAVVDPRTVPAGIELAGYQLYPAADALRGLPLRAESLFAEAPDQNVPILTWVLAENQGRENATALLRHHIKRGGHSASQLKKALKLLEKSNEVDGLLPPVWKRFR